jgi:hypothetical protein
MIAALTDQLICCLAQQAVLYCRFRRLPLWSDSSRSDNNCSIFHSSSKEADLEKESAIRSIYNNTARGSTLLTVCTVAGPAIRDDDFMASSFMTLPGLALFYGGLVRKAAQCLGIQGL